jgi:hypothetical protein
MALLRASVRNVIVALVVPEIPRVVRVVRASVVSLREQTMVEAARVLDHPLPRRLPASDGPRRQSHRRRAEEPSQGQVDPSVIDGGAGARGSVWATARVTRRPARSPV